MWVNLAFHKKIVENAPIFNGCDLWKSDLKQCSDLTPFIKFKKKDTSNQKWEKK